MRTLMVAFVVAAMVFVPLGIVGTASAASPTRNLAPVVIGPVSTDRFGGGDFVGVKAGDALFGEPVRADRPDDDGGRLARPPDGVTWPPASSGRSAPPVAA